MRVAAAVITALGVLAIFKAASPLYYDGFVHEGLLCDAFLPIVTIVLAAIGALAAAVAARCRRNWVTVAVWSAISFLAFFPYWFLGGRLPHSVEPIQSSTPTTVSCFWILYVLLSYLAYRTLRSTARLRVRR